MRSHRRTSGKSWIAVAARRVVNDGNWRYVGGDQWHLRRLARTAIDRRDAGHNGHHSRFVALVATGRIGEGLACRLPVVWVKPVGWRVGYSYDCGYYLRAVCLGPQVPIGRACGV